MKSTNGYSKNPIFFTSHHKCILHSPDKPFSRKGFSKKPIFFTSQKCIHRHYSDILPFSAKGFSKNPIFFTSLKCIHSPDEPISSNSKNSSVVCCFTTLHETPVQPLTVAEKVHCLACEFKSLSEPIDRVKKLLHYAALLPPFDQSGRVEENRVMGCTTMVWLEVEMDSASRLMRFKLDSDSEITKGFCACLLWLLDGAVPEEVLNVKIDDLAEMNVGMPSKGHSRVNTWHNILISMQKKTTNFVEVQDRDRPLT
ncbi:hypothetical protein ACH5RR_030753 [Cinchona calisaya]|uniref:Fe-S metabolism associated domain-containing protein n=1 Tax=Cinchona calisaya TaxID=153742 RepID=A0ABD2YZT1_9GENT